MGREPTELEHFDRTHKRKGGEGVFVDSKSEKVRVSPCQSF